MSTFEITGTSYYVSHEDMKTLLLPVFEEVVSNDQGFVRYEIKCKSANSEAIVSTSSNTGSSWSINAEFKGKSEEMEAFVDRLEAAFLEKDVLYSIGYCEIDEEDEPISEEMERSHPEFDERYEPPKE